MRQIPYDPTLKKAPSWGYWGADRVIVCPHGHLSVLDHQVDEADVLSVECPHGSCDFRDTVRLLTSSRTW